MTPPLLQVCLAAALLTPPLSADTLWTTNPNLPTTFVSPWVIGPSVLTPSVDAESADDFNVIGSVERVLVDGQDCNSCGFGTPVTGARVNFYAWTPNGPGALQKQYEFVEGDPAFQWATCCGPHFLQFDLPEPFQATGLHYVSVQLELSEDLDWNVHRANVGAPMAGPAYRRDGHGWIVAGSDVSLPQSDLSFRLEGVSGGVPAPAILTVQGAPFTPSARLRISGNGFGTQGAGDALHVNGVPAIVTQWHDQTVIAYVPEQTLPGQALVELVLDGEVADSELLDVQPRASDGRVNWRFTVDSDYTLHRPGLAPDGSVYINDVDGRLYKLSADGGLQWVVDALRGQPGNGAEGPVVVGDDGRVYVVVNPLGPDVDLVAYDPDGSLAWVFTDPGALSIVSGPAVGPDGNVYAAFFGPAGPSLGICSVRASDGSLRWNNMGSPLLYEEGALGSELAFGSSQLGGAVDQVIFTSDQNGPGRLAAFDMQSGSENFSVAKIGSESYLLQPQGEVHTGPDGSIYVTEFVGLGGAGWGLQAFEPTDGDRTWRFDPGILSEASAPDIDLDGNLYFSWDISRVSGVSPSGDELWTHVDFGGVRSAPSVSPAGSRLIVAGGLFGQPGRWKVLDTDSGAELWRVELPHENGDVIPDARPLFAPDGLTAYAPTLVLADPQPFQVSYLYALDMSDGPCQPDLGYGGPGAAQLSVCGSGLGSGQTSRLDLTGAPALGTAWLALGFSENPTPFKGGVFVPLPFTLLKPLQTDAAGELSIAEIPGGLGSLDVLAQFVLEDAAQPAGYGFSNAVRLEFQP